MSPPSVAALRSRPLEFVADGFREVKDPCVVRQGRRWHMYGTGITATSFEILHASAAKLEGPWRLHDSVDVSAVEGSCVAAPGVVVHKGVVHMFLQTEYDRHGGRIVHLVSHDEGCTFTESGTALASSPRAGEAGVYDPHPVRIGGDCFLAYAAFTVAGQPELHLAKSRSRQWDGPWERLGPMLRHEDVSFHNQLGGESYEWGLEAPQLLRLPDRRVLLLAVCFLAGEPLGHRQSLFVATADAPAGPYTVLQPALRRATGESGHGCAVARADEILVLHQERDGAGERWRYALGAVGLSMFTAGQLDTTDSVDDDEVNAA